MPGKINPKQERFNILFNAEQEGKPLRPEHRQELERMKAEGYTITSGGAGGGGTTEGERKSSAFLTRALGANRDYERVKPGPRGLAAQKFNDIAPNLANVTINDDDRQVTDSAQAEFVAATLRYDSGAAIPPAELEAQKRIYFPQPGDGIEARNQKARARARALQGLIESSGRALDPKLRDQYPEFFKDGTKGAAGVTPPAGTPPTGTPPNSPAGGPPDETESGLQRFARDGLGGSDTGDHPLNVEVTDDRRPGETDEQYAARAQKESGSQQAQTDKARDTPLGAIDATIRGATDTLTLGSSDEITGFMNALGTGDLSKGPINSEIQRQRDIDAADARVNPWARMGGQFAGGLLLPYSKGSILKSGAQGAALGGAYGFGSGEGGITDRLPNALSGAVVGGALGAGVPAAVNGISAVYSKAKAPINAARTVADNLGINSTPATTGGALSRGLQMAYGNLPGSSAAVENAAARETGDLANAARTVAGDLGPVSTPAGSGKAIARGAGAWERVTRKEAQRLYGERDKLMGGPDVPVPMVESRAAIDSFAQRFPNSPVLATLRESPAVRRLEKALPDKGVLTLRESTEILSEARAALRNARRNGAVTPAMEARIADVEQAIENDVLNAARQVDQAAGRTTGGAADAQMTADKYYRSRAILKSGALKTPLSSRTDDVLASSESVYRQVSGDMAEKGGNMARLQAVWNNLPSGAKRKFAATKFDELGKATNGQQNADKTAWSFNTFLTNYSDLNADARKLVFGAQEDKIRDIATYAERLRQVDKSRNFSNTAKNTIAGAFMTVLGSALWRGDTAMAAETIAAVPAAWGSAKIFLSTPAMRSWTARALKATQQATNTGNAAPLKSLTGQLSSIAAREPAISGDIISLQNYLASKFSETPSRAAAAPGQDRNDRRPPPVNYGQ